MSVDYSAVFAGLSALCALITLYLYRSQGKGFIWTKDPTVSIGVLPNNGNMQVIVQIPLWNLGTGNLRFLSLKAKKVALKNNSVEVFDQDMDEAYFPPGALVITYRSPIYNDLSQPIDSSNTRNQIRIIDPQQLEKIEASSLQESINSKMQAIGDIMFILTCKYKDGSWFGLSVKETTIAMEYKNLDLYYLSTERRKQLNNLFL